MQDKNARISYRQEGGAKQHPAVLSLRSFALICAHLHSFLRTTAFRTTAFGNSRLRPARQRNLAHGSHGMFVSTFVGERDRGTQVSLSPTPCLPALMSAVCHAPRDMRAQPSALHPRPILIHEGSFQAPHHPPPKHLLKLFLASKVFFGG